MASKYLIHCRGRHVFNPSNLALVLAFLILGSRRVEPLQFWWGPLSPALVIVLLDRRRRARRPLAGRAARGRRPLLGHVRGGLGVLALSGHAFSANWHLGPVADGYFWKVLVTSPEVFIFLSFMITDPRTAPETPRGRRIYAVAIGLLGALLIAPMQTEFGAKVALLGSLTIVCAARPLSSSPGGARAAGAAQAVRAAPARRRGAARSALAAFAGLLSSRARRRARSRSSVRSR